jgi:hypothetical protein
VKLVLAKAGNGNPELKINNSGFLLGLAPYSIRGRNDQIKEHLPDFKKFENLPKLPGKLPFSSKNRFYLTSGNWIETVDGFGKEESRGKVFPKFISSL